MTFRAKQNTPALNLNTLAIPEGDEVRVTVRHCPITASLFFAHQHAGEPLLSGDRLFLETESGLFLLTVTKSLL